MKHNMLDPREIHEGQEVVHPKLGKGRITMVNHSEKRCSVEYENGGFFLGSRFSDALQDLRIREQTWIEKSSRDRLDPASRRALELLDILHKYPLKGNTKLCPGKPNREDIRLAKRWADRQSIPSAAVEAMMISARMAEKAVGAYWNQLGKTVKDVSIQQLSQRSGSEWELYDLMVGDLPIDVKNARRSERNPRAYVSHCVPKFKQSCRGTQVRIAGALSKWLPVEAILAGDSRVQILGTVSASKIDELKTMLRGGSLDFSVCSLRSPEFLPSWIFDYSDGEYDCLRARLEEVGKLFQANRACAQWTDSDMMPVLLAAGISDPPDGLVNSGSWVRDLIKIIAERQREFGLSLPGLFLTILEHFCSMLGGDPPSDYHPREYRWLLFTSRIQDERPLFLFDPEISMSSLISALEKLWEHRNGDLRQIRSLRLRELNILSGRRDGRDEWRTILAYCGGWIKTKKASKPCGNTPLVLGECQTCECLRLICPRCGFCSKGCHLCKDRQRQFEKERDQRADHLDEDVDIEF